ncbi:amidotransferase [Solemya pervernicosa gill symbiont]|uniref:Amidotransferase n=2 Tax=Gammaproteobacteria incertae sedis TaxID=118884 RepID=A0A1T2L116_9GAMM|nr:type 1 glutamine amidotransferase [Candidatus Reidiella endopervernicosa]OOZ38789.1 amidotransferase [Solemya pervernicosa gill symbiont]QKQ25919.1 type 1 glutamine amidotransferase [Candidatus Reidiella endopervernicosa]
MHIHYLQHVPFEGIGSIQDWADRGGHTVSRTRLYAGDQFPAIDRFDLLVVMGGPMNIYEYSEYPWLKVEKGYIKQVIEADKAVLGVCLGAQLIADVLGGPVVDGREKEIGWFDIKRSAEVADHPLALFLDDQCEVFHWHGDTFNIPPGAIHLASSGVCDNQGFIYNDRVVALQFHLETTAESAAALIENCAGELAEGGAHIQSGAEMMADGARYAAINQRMNRLLDAMAATLN